MKETLAVALTLCVLCAARAGAEFACDASRPRCRDLAVPLPSGSSFGAIDNRVRIFLPAGYASTTKSYPVLYLLHGAGDTYRTWSDNTDVYDLTGPLDLIVVMPDGGKNAEAGWYSDWFDGSRKWESFHVGVLIPYVDSSFRTLGAGHRAVAGLSMGGFGAMHDAAHHPELFTAAASFSGAVDVNYGFPLSGAGFTVFHQQFGTPADGIWGNQTTEQSNWRTNNPTDLAWYFRGLKKLLVATGNGGPGGPHDDPSNPGGYFIEAVIERMNRSFVKALDAAGVDHTDNFYGPGQHSWPYWQDDLHWALPELMQVIR